MLAAASAWRILEAEHTRLRQLLAAIARVLADNAWRHPGPQRDLLRRHIQEFRDFETNAHKPKGVVLLDSMRGRSPEADALLDELEDESQHCDQLLSQALEGLGSRDPGGKAGPGEVASLLQQHQELMMRHLEREDTALRSFTAQLLTSDEWSAVVSSISSVAQRARGRREHTKR
jgi:hemerythrin-like domain-containing protein